MKSNKDENELWKIEIEAKMKKIKTICCIIFVYIDNIYFISTEISLKKFFFRNLKYRSMILYGFSLCSMRTIHCRIFYIYLLDKPIESP